MSQNLVNSSSQNQSSVIQNCGNQVLNPGPYGPDLAKHDGLRNL